MKENIFAWKPLDLAEAQGMVIARPYQNESQEEEANLSDASDDEELTEAEGEEKEHASSPSESEHSSDSETDEDYTLPNGDEEEDELVTSESDAVLEDGDGDDSKAGRMSDDDSDIEGSSGSEDPPRTLMGAMPSGFVLCDAPDTLTAALVGKTIMCKFSYGWDSGVVRSETKSKNFNYAVQWADDDDHQRQLLKLDKYSTECSAEDYSWCVVAPAPIDWSQAALTRSRKRRKKKKT